MADLLSPGISFEYIRDEVLTHITSSRGSRHIWLWLTKQAKRMVELSDWMKGAGLPWPSNLWPGVSLTTAASAWRIDYLMRVPARHHFVSYEPAWEWIPIFERATFPDWVIVGGQSGRGAARRPFDVTIAARLLSERKKHGTAVFVKQMGRTTAGLPGSTAVREWIDTHGGDWNEWPDEFRVREFPKLA